MTTKCGDVLLACAISLASGAAFACAPPPPRTLTDQQQVAQWYAQSDDVFLATLVKVVAKPLPNDGPYPMPKGFEIPAEYVEFRIDKVYKGKRRVGSRYDTVSSGFGASCAVSVLDLSSWYGQGEKKLPLSKQWVFYTSGPGPYRIDNSHTATPVNRMIGNLGMLEKIQKK